MASPQSCRDKTDILNAPTAQPAARPTPRLLPGLDLGGDEADVIDSRTAHDVDRARHLCERDIIVPLHKCNLVGALLKDVKQAATEHVPITLILIDHDLSAI